MPETGHNTTVMFSYMERPLLAFEQFDFLLQVLQQETDTGGSVWVQYLKPWNWDGKWEDTASYLVKYQVPAANVLRKMEDVHLHDDGRNGLTFSTEVQVFSIPH